MLCCGYTLTDFPISIRLTSLALWQSNDCPSASKQPWWIWINTSCEFIMNDCITTTKQSTTKPCAYFLGYTVLAVWITMVMPNRMICLWNKYTCMRYKYWFGHHLYYIGIESLYRTFSYGLLQQIPAPDIVPSSTLSFPTCSFILFRSNRYKDSRVAVTWPSDAWSMKVCTIKVHMFTIKWQEAIYSSVVLDSTIHVISSDCAETTGRAFCPWQWYCCMHVRSCLTRPQFSV